MEKLNLIQKKSDIMNAISTHFSDEMCKLNKVFHHCIPYSEELKIYNKLDIIEKFLTMHGIDVQELKDTNRI